MELEDFQDLLQRWNPQAEGNGMPGQRPAVEVDETSVRLTSALRPPGRLCFPVCRFSTSPEKLRSSLD